MIGDDQRLRAITPGPSGGTLAWRANTMATTDSFSPENAPSVASDGTIWTAISFFEEVPGGITISNRIYAIKPDGAVAFDYEMSTPKILIGAPAIDVNDWAFYVYHDCLAAFGRSGSSYGYKFSLTVPSGTRKIATMPAISTPSYGTDGNGAYTNQLVYWAENPSSQIGRVYALRLKQYANGTHATSQAWTPWSFPGGTSESAIQHLALGSDNSIYVTTKVGSSTHKLHKLNGNTGAHLWTANLTFQPNTSPVLGVDGTVYFGGVVSDIQGNFSYGVYKVHPTTQAVTLFAATTHPVKGAPLVDVTGKIYAAYDGGSTANFRCFNPSGSVAWTESYSGNWGQTAPVMDRKGRIYMLRTAGTTEGDLIALKGSGRPAFSDWPMWGRGFSRNSRAGKTWRFMELDTLGGAYSVAEGISENGRVVGGAHSNTGVYLGAHVVPGTYWWWGLFLNIPYDTPAFGANNYGIIVGYTLQNGGPQAYYTQGGWGQTLLDFLPSGHTAAAVAVNENARIVGYSHNSSGVQRGVFWSYGPTAPTDIRTLAGLNPSFASTANAVSSSGRITGSSQNTSGQYRAFLTDLTGIIQGPGDDLGTLSGGNYSAGHGINDAEAVTGAADNASGVARIFYKPFGPNSTHPMQEVGLLPGATYGSGEDINNNNLIVGYCYVNGYARASVAVGGLTGVADLNNATSGITYQSLNVANAVNDREWIVGWGLNSGWAYRGFILRPNE